MKYILITLFVFILNCKGNKVSNYHGNKLLDKKFDVIKINSTNKNDLLQLIGPPSSISDFDKNKWFYIERLKTNQSIIKLGNQIIKKNNVLIVEFNEMGIIKNKEILNLENMNDLKYLKKTTEKDFKQDNVIYNIFTSLREKINAPARTRKK
tara:strand:- start:54 stop:509 length:456 start_codon:yes stop_codon:yes gene_type:complete